MLPEAIENPPRFSLRLGSNAQWRLYGGEHGPNAARNFAGHLFREDPSLFEWVPQ